MTPKCWFKCSIVEQFQCEYATTAAADTADDILQLDNDGERWLSSVGVSMLWSQTTTTGRDINESQACRLARCITIIFFCLLSKFKGFQLKITKLHSSRRRIRKWNGSIEETPILLSANEILLPFYNREMSRRVTFRMTKSTHYSKLVRECCCDHLFTNESKSVPPNCGGRALIRLWYF